MMMRGSHSLYESNLLIIPFFQVLPETPSVCLLDRHVKAKHSGFPPMGTKRTRVSVRRQDRILARDPVSLQDLAPIVNIMACSHFELMMLINRQFPRGVPYDVVRRMYYWVAVSRSRSVANSVCVCARE